MMCRKTPNLQFMKSENLEFLIDCALAEHTLLVNYGGKEGMTLKLLVGSNNWKKKTDTCFSFLNIVVEIRSSDTQKSKPTRHHHKVIKHDTQ